MSVYPGPTALELDPHELAARYQPLPNGRGSAQARAGRVIQIRLGGRGSFRMTAAEARDFAAGLLEMASPMLPGQVLVVKYKPPGAKFVRHKRVMAGEVLPFAGRVMAACRRAERGSLFEEVTSR